MENKIKTLIAVIVCCVLNPFAASAQEKNHNFEVAKNLETFAAIYRNLDMLYVDSLDADEVIGYGIRAMLRSLDPYTEYYPASEVKNLKTMFTGKYAGIGSTVRKNLKTNNVVIDQPYAGMPAAEAGLRKGDEILSINDSSMLGKDVSYVSERLRGDAGTTFLLKVRRPSLTKQLAETKMITETKAKTKTKAKAKAKAEPADGPDVLTFKIMRRAIQMPAVPYYGMVSDGIGFINLDSFTEDCSTVVKRALIDLRSKNMKGLIFDLRGNGGGSLQEAVKIVNFFVPKGITIVTQKGKIENVNRSHATTEEPIDTVMPVVVLIDGNTASASEITAGSLQDLDRATILGTKSYGKGLVQMPMDLPYNASMKLTTAKYYIPSGRCVQAINYSRSNGGSREYVADSLKHVFYTKGGRPVHDGSGITPDQEVKADSLPNIAFYLSVRDSSEVVNDWIVNYIGTHATIAEPEKFAISDAEYADFKQAVISSSFKYDQETSKFYDDLVRVAKFEGYYDEAKSEFDALKSKLTHNTERDLDINAQLIKQILSTEIVAAYYYQSGALAHQITFDKQVKEAIRVLQEQVK